jgi:hypothetical protein
MEFIILKKTILATLFTNLILIASVVSNAQAGAGHLTKGNDTLPQSTVTEINARRQQVLEWSRIAAFQENLKYGPVDILAATARDGCGPKERAEYMTHIGQMGIGKEAFEMFALSPLVRYLYMYGQCMTEDQKRLLINGLAGTRRTFFSHGTMNHMVLQETSWYLLAQYFPNAQWTDENGAQWTSPQLMAQMKDLLARRHWRSFQSGMDEMLSPTYAFTNLYPILNLVDFAKDKDVADQAADEATLEVLVLKASSFHGVLLPPLTRHNQDQSNAPLLKNWPNFAPIAQEVLWYYFGEPQIGPYDLANPIREPVYPIMLALSSWRPPLAAWSMPAGGYRIQIRTPDFAKWDNPTFPIAYGDTWVGTNYALATGNFLFDPRFYNDHSQSFALAFRSDARRNLLEIKQPYWLSNDGEDAWGTDFWSPFLESWRIDNHHAVLLASIPEKDPWTKAWSSEMVDRAWKFRDKHKDALLQLVQCRIPKAVDELVVEDRWAFFRKGSVYVAVGSLAGSFERVQSGLPAILDADFTVLKVRRAETALYVSVEEQGGSFAEFQRRAKASAPRYSADGPSVSMGATTVRFVPPAPDSAHPGYWRALPEAKVNGKVQPYRDAPVIESSFLTLSNGVLQVKGKKPLEIHGPEKPSGERYGKTY